MRAGHSDQEVRILPATEEHLPAIAQLAGIIWRACYPGIISPEQIDYMLARMYSLETLRREIRAEKIHYDRLLIGNELAGFASYGPVAAGVFKLHKIYLQARWQGCGLGSRLLRHCEQSVRSLGAHTLTLNVNKRNVKAIAAYRRNGFAVIESAVADIGGGFVMDDFVMSKALAIRASESRR